MIGFKGKGQRAEGRGQRAESKGQKVGDWRLFFQPKVPTKVHG